MLDSRVWWSSIAADMVELCQEASEKNYLEATRQGQMSKRGVSGDTVSVDISW